ncbi:MAG: nucleotidyltransferase family protein, partial [Terriglobia bacterium]
DWPKRCADAIAREVNEFHDSHAELHRVQQGSQEWVSVTHGWEPDYESAEAIGERFSRHFPGRVKWVESEKNRRGQIAGSCMVEGAGEFQFQLTWRDSTVRPLDALGEDARASFANAAREVMDWAESRIQPILDTLKARLQEHYGAHYRGLYVFGSYAQPDAGILLPEDSDLDVAVLLTDMESSYAEIQATGAITTDLSLEHGLSISLVHLREADFREGRTNFTRVISEYARPA